MNIFHILVVEDEPNIAGTIVRALQSEFGPQAEIATCVNAEDALVLLNSEPVHLLISDNQLPNMSGLELIAQAHNSLPGLKIIFMTASSSLLCREMANEYADLFMTKPFKLPQFIGNIRELMQTSQGQNYGDYF